MAIFFLFSNAFRAGKGNLGCYFNLFYFLLFKLFFFFSQTVEGKERKKFTRKIVQFRPFFEYIEFTPDKNRVLSFTGKKKKARGGNYIKRCAQSMRVLSEECSGIVKKYRADILFRRAYKESISSHGVDKNETKKYRKLTNNILLV